MILGRDKDNDELIILRSGYSATGDNSFSNLVGTGSNKHIVGLDAVIHLFGSSCPIVVNHCSFSLGVMNEAEILDAVEMQFTQYQKMRRWRFLSGFCLYCQ